MYLIYLKKIFSFVTEKMKNCGKCQSGWWVVLLTATLAAPAMGEAGACLFNAKLKQIITSNTLKWASLKKEVMSNYVIGAESEQGLHLNTE